MKFDRVVPLDFKRKQILFQGFITYSATKTNVIRNLAFEILVICRGIRSVTTLLLDFLNMTVNYFFFRNAGKETLDLIGQTGQMG